MIPFIDSHAHLAGPEFDEDRAAVIRRAREAGAMGIVCVGESPSSARRAAALAENHPGFIWFTAGVHPHDAASFDPQRDVQEIERLASAGAVAIGECGLDYHYENSPRELQRRAFARQLELARERQLPVVVHTRDAEHDTAAMLAEAAQAGVRGVLHCFTGTPWLADTAIEAGWLISFSGIITFSRWDAGELARRLPDDRLLVESDAPYLAPVPMRGRRNEPAWVAHTLLKLADIRGGAVQDLAQVVMRNTESFYGVAVSDSL